MRIGLKDLYNQKGQYNNLGFEEPSPFKFKPLKDSFVVDKLKANHDLTRNLCMPFGVGELDFRITDANNNPYGGSSSGSAQAVYEDKIDLALVTDTGGSCIYPAARCGKIYGFKPTYGAISRQGLVPLCSTLDTVSMMSKSPEYLKQIYDQLNVKDELDPTNEIKNVNLEDPKINIPVNLFSESDVKYLTSKYPNNELTKFELHGLDTTELLNVLLGAYLYQQTPDLFSNMARFNSYFQPGEKSLRMSNYSESKIEEIREKQLNLEIKTRILMGAHLLNKKYDPNLKVLFSNHLDVVLGSKVWVFPVCSKDIKSNQLNLSNSPIWPLISNLTKRPSLVTPESSNTEGGFYITGPVNSDKHILGYAVDKLK